MRPRPPAISQAQLTQALDMAGFAPDDPIRTTAPKSRALQYPHVADCIATLAEKRDDESWDEARHRVDLRNLESYIQTTRSVRDAKWNVETLAKRGTQDPDVLRLQAAARKKLAAILRAQRIRKIRIRNILTPACWRIFSRRRNPSCEPGWSGKA